jgi:carboxyl-terminal processing protease
MATAMLIASATIATLPLACTTPSDTSAARPSDDQVATAAPQGTPIDAAAATETFDAVWSRVNDHHFDPEFNGVDWIAIRETYRPRVEAVETQQQLRMVLTEMLGELGQSHFGLIPGEAFASDVSDVSDVSDLSDLSDQSDLSDTSGLPGWSGITARFHDGAALVTAVADDSPASRAGVRPGDTVESIDGRPVARFADLLASDPDSPMLRYEMNAMLNGRLAPAIGERRELELRNTGGDLRTVVVTGAASPDRMVGMGNLPPMRTTLDHRMLDAIALSELGLEPCGGDLVGVIAFSVWLPAISEDFDRAIDASRETLGVVIDLRGNPGGLGAMAMGFGGHFADRPISLGTMSTRDTSLHFRVNPRRVDRAGRPVEPLDVPLAIIVDEMSASTSEIFAGGMQEAGLARIFGRRTPGAALPATATDLPNGDVLLAAMADFTTPNGVRLEGRGVVPDETIELTSANLAEGDPDLRAAAAWILEQYLMPGEDDAGEPTT